MGPWPLSRRKGKFRAAVPLSPLGCTQSLPLGKGENNFSFSLLAQYYVKNFLTTASIIFKAVQKRSTILFFIVSIFFNNVYIVSFSQTEEQWRGSGWIVTAGFTHHKEVFVGGPLALQF